MTKRKLPIISFTWAEGKYLDAWSIVHVLSGGILALLLSYTPLSALWAFATAILAMIFWEFFEIYFQFGETIQNMFTDIITGILGYLLVITFVPFQSPIKYWALIFLFLINAVLGFLGWYAFFRRTGEKISPEIKEKQKQFKEKQKKFREEFKKKIHKK